MTIKPIHARGLALCLLTAAIAVVAFVNAGGDDGPRPNVLLLVMDTARGDRCSVMGYGRPTTPRLDELAKDGVAFRRAWSPANWTGPAHASLFTGMGAGRQGLVGSPRPFLPSDIPTLAERFGAAGYDTACFTNNEFVSPEFGLARGFAKFDPLYRDSGRGYPWARGTHESAAAWAEAAHAAGKPFFLFINDVEPHQPYSPPSDDAVPFMRTAVPQAELSALRSFSNRQSLAYNLGVLDVGDRHLGILSDLYDAEIFALDREIGRLLDRLRKGGLLDKTVVVIVGDHGEMLGEHRLIDHGVGLYAPVLHVPLVVRFPGAFDGGRVVDDLVRLEDVAPTLLELCRLDAFERADGVSLTGGLKGRVARALLPPDDWVSIRAATEMPGNDTSSLAQGVRSVYDGTRHLIRSENGRIELYDPVLDPLETDDLSAHEPQEVARLLRLLDAER
jgi:arylsulfatase A-like enzyme